MTDAAHAIVTICHRRGAIPRQTGGDKGASAAEVLPAVVDGSYMTSRQKRMDPRRGRNTGAAGVVDFSDDIATLRKRYGHIGVSLRDHFPPSRREKIADNEEMRQSGTNSENLAGVLLPSITDARSAHRATSARRSVEPPNFGQRWAARREGEGCASPRLECGHARIEHDHRCRLTSYPADAQVFDDDIVVDTIMRAFAAKPGLFDAAERRDFVGD